MPRPVHPEALEGEVWIGNMWGSDFPKVGWQTKRKGKIAYHVHGRKKGKRIPGSCRPCFVQRSEITAAGVAIPDDHTPINHRW